MAATSRSASSSEGVCTGKYSCCTGLFATNSGICLSLVLVGIDDIDEHGVPGINAGHRQNSALHSLHNCFSMSREI